MPESNTTSNTNNAAVEKLREQVRRAREDQENEEILEIISTNSGWSLADMEENPHKITTFELFLLNIPRVPELRFFPNLVTVKLTHVGLTSMLDLNSLTLVEELWLSDNYITKIEALENMTKLRRLYLQGNSITSMEGLPVLKHLRELWLCRNEIREITGLENVRKLRALWIASNPICSLVGAFSNQLTYLHDVNLAGCHIYSFQHIAYLTPLPCLRNVWFADPLFGDNPICRLNNYTTFTLYLLDSLDTLDHGIISSEQRALAQSIFGKKRVYYSMRIHTLNRNYGLMYQYAMRLADGKQKQAMDATHRINKYLTPTRLALRERQLFGNKSSAVCDTVPQPRLEEVEREMNRAVGTREVQMQTVHKRLAQAVQSTTAMKAKLQQRLCVELNTGGNIRLEEVTSPTDSWYESAKELLLARFAPESFKKYGIKAVKVCRVKRVVNRGLRLRFDDRVKQLDIDMTDASNRKTLVCLFTTVPSDEEQQLALTRHALIHGMEPRSDDASLLSSYLPSTNEGIPLTNSLFYADEERLNKCQRSGELSGINANPNSHTGQLIISRVFLGKSVQALGGNSASTAGGDKEASYIGRSKKVLAKDYNSDVFSVYRIPPDEQNVRVWYCMDRSLILPEFVIDYTYIMELPMTISPAISLAATGATLPQSLQDALDALLPLGMTRSDWDDLQECCYPLIDFLQWCVDDNFMKFADEETKTVIKSAKELLEGRLIAQQKAAGSSSEPPAPNPITDGTIQTYYSGVGNPAVEKRLICQLQSQRITSLPKELETSRWTPLLQLDLSDNRIDHFSWFALAKAAPNIQHLNLHGNSLKTLDLNATTFQGLYSLDVSCNKLESLSCMQQMHVSFPNIRDLRTYENPCMESKNATLTLLSFFPSTSSLRELNGFDLEGLNKMSVPRWMRARTLDLSDDKVASQGLQYLLKDACEASSQQQHGTFADLESLDSRVVPERFFEKAISDIERTEPQKRTKAIETAVAKLAHRDELDRVHSLAYSYTLTQQVSWVSLLPAHLQHLSLRGHSISDITPILTLVNLEVLDVQDNCIASLPDMSDLKRLRYVDVSFNKLTKIASMGKLTEVRWLNLSCNELSALEAPVLVACVKLEELYISHNKLQSVSEFYSLKDLPQLMTLDVCGNPIMEGCSKEDLFETRSYFIFNFRQLKVLNSSPISQGDSQRARDVFAGKLSTDLLAERTRKPKSAWKNMTELDLSNCTLREVALLEPFTSLQILKLHHNVLIKIEGISPLRQLRALDLAFNRLGQTNNASIGEALKQLPQLESLSLEANHISDLGALALQLPQLKFLNLKSNDLQYLDRGLQKLPLLRELILDQNKLRGFSPDCFAGCRFLSDISADDNAIRSTDGLQRLQRLERISIGANRIPDLPVLLQDLSSSPLVNATFIGNAATRKGNYRIAVVGAFPGLTMLDSKAVTREEREKAEQAKTCEYVPPPNVVMDLGYLHSLQQQQQQGGDGSAVGNRAAPGAAQPGRLIPVNQKKTTYGRGGGGGAMNSSGRTAPRGM